MTEARLVTREQLAAALPDNWRIGSKQQFSEMLFSRLPVAPVVIEGYVNPDGSGEGNWPAAAPAEGLREALAAAVIQTGRQLVLRTNDEPNDGLYEVAAAMERNLAALARHESGSE